jgi:hypothetical protein
MFVRRNTRAYKGKTYTNYLLVETVRTPAGPRQKTVCSLGDLGPARRSVWLERARKLQQSLAAHLEKSGENQSEAARGFPQPVPPAQPGKSASLAALNANDTPMLIDPHAISTDRYCEVGAAHVGNEFWKRLGLDEILRELGLGESVRRLACAMTLNSLIATSHERAIVEWMCRTGLDDILGIDIESLTEANFCEALDSLHPHRAAIEAALAERERNMFNQDSVAYLCDLASIVALRPVNYRPLNTKSGLDGGSGPLDDCQEVAVAVAFGREGFPICHEIGAGCLRDGANLQAILDRMAARGGLAKSTIVIVDRDLSDAANLILLKQRGLDYLITNPQSEHDRVLADFAKAKGFTQVIRIPPVHGYGVRGSPADLLLFDERGQAHILFREKHFIAKDGATRRRQEQCLIADFNKLCAQITGGALTAPDKIGGAIGGLKERYPRVAAYYDIVYDPAVNAVSLTRDESKANYVEQLDGAILLETDRADISTEEARGLRGLLTGVKTTFGALRMPLGGRRQILSHVEPRSEVQIFLCVLAFHVATAIEKALCEGSAHTTWMSAREVLRSHQLCTVKLCGEDGRCLCVREAAKPNPDVASLYATLGVPAKVTLPH